MISGQACEGGGLAEGGGEIEFLGQADRRWDGGVD